MIKDCILIFENNDQPIETDDLLSYDGGEDFASLYSLEAKVDTREFTLSFLGDTFPNIKKLRLNNSIIPSVRDIGCTLVNLRFLSLARCNLTSLDGIGTLSQNLEELYLAFNKITDVCDLMGMEKLKIIDLEDNQLAKLENIEILSLSTKLRALTLAGNPAAQDPAYREKISKLLPQLMYLDEKRIRPKTPKKKTGTRCPAPVPKSTSEDKLQRADSPQQQQQQQQQQQKQPQSILQNSSAQSTPKKEQSDTQIRSFNPVSINDMDDETPPKPEKTVVFADLPPAEVPTVDIGQISPEKVDSEHIMTELVEDLVEDRPPTSRGFYGNNVFKGLGKSPNKKQKTQKLFSSTMPRIVRPMSAKGRPF